MPKADRQLVLAVDLGGTKIAAGLVSIKGEIISRGYCLTMAEEGPEVVIKRLLSLTHRTLKRAGIKNSELKGVGVAAAGALDIRKGLVTASPNLPDWRNVPLQRIVGEEIGMKTYLINDASAAALGEHRLGAGRGVSNLIYLTISTGIGGGMILGGQLYIGTDGCAGEIGHMTVDVNGPQCNCGNVGCLETLASGTAMAKEAIRRLSQGERSSLVALVRGKLENIDAKLLARAARQGDSLACDVISNAAYYLGIGMVNLVNIFNPERIVVGGGVAQMGDLLLEPARRVVKERAFSLPVRTARIVRAKLGGDSGIIGAALFVFQEPKGGR